MSVRSLKVALAGNPNSGKTTIFNQLTGGRQSVGNYPGVTVEKKSGHCVHQGLELELVDLPGTYGLTAYSLDEKVARDFVITEQPDVVVNVIDASNLERNLYLTTQLLELGVPLVLVFNMSDVAEGRGIKFDLEALSASFGGPVVSVVGNRNQGLDRLLTAVVCQGSLSLERKDGPPQRVREGGKHGGVGAEATQVRRLDYGLDVERELALLEPLAGADEGLCRHYGGLLRSPLGARWLALKLIEQDTEVVGLVAAVELRARVKESQARLTETFGEAPSLVIADRRYGYISGACQEAVRNTVENRHLMSDKIDEILTHRIFGLPLFLLFMYLVFNLTFKAGDPLMRGLESLFDWLKAAIVAHWPALWGPTLKSLVVDGVIGGVGGVIVFLPNIVLLFLGIALLEYSGYMARAAFVMDRLMHRMGLHGKSFIPMLLGFGCSVPAIMATRALDGRRDRLITMLVIPLMSCGARLTIYTLLISAFFPPHWYAPMLMLIYVIGIVLAVLGAKLLGRTLLKGESPGLVIELPPYRLPTPRSVLILMWERAWLYLKKAGTVILGISILMWALTTYPRRTDLPAGLPANQVKAEQLASSAAGRLGHLLEPVLAPMGFDWKLGTALIGAVAAKEVFVSQLGVVYALGETGESPESLRDVLRKAYSPLVGFCVMLFCLIGFPCVATVAIVRAESGRWRWALFQFVALTLLAYVVTVVVYQTGTWLQHLAQAARS